ncbi:hypothetical protein [Streptomyces acidiscabies]|uniref:Uncharacterized protein n=1 Tax=Streptomyces acidiscabies TaxID=42234 RepID=A0ABU4LYZ5_9ACTN|nr:hypothetical protein [Streptomyces acidiscabies]MDX3020137.1 hypothetical protein [Streptomyces acidiscabies]
MRTNEGSAHAIRPLPLPGAASRPPHEVLLKQASAAHPVPFTSAGPKTAEAAYHGMGSWKHEGPERGACT